MHIELVRAFIKKAYLNGRLFFLLGFLLERNRCLLDDHLAVVDHVLVLILVIVVVVVLLSVVLFVTVVISFSVADRLVHIFLVLIFIVVFFVIIFVIIFVVVVVVLVVGEDVLVVLGVARYELVLDLFVLARRVLIVDERLHVLAALVGRLERVRLRGHLRHDQLQLALQLRQLREQLRARIHHLVHRAQRVDHVRILYIKKGNN